MLLNALLAFAFIATVSSTPPSESHLQNRICPERPPCQTDADCPEFTPAQSIGKIGRPEAGYVVLDHDKDTFTYTGDDAVNVAGHFHLVNSGTMNQKWLFSDCVADGCSICRDRTDEPETDAPTADLPVCVGAYEFVPTKGFFYHNVLFGLDKAMTCELAGGCYFDDGCTQTGTNSYSCTNMCMPEGGCAECPTRKGTQVFGDCVAVECPTEPERECAAAQPITGKCRGNTDCYNEDVRCPISGNTENKGFGVDGTDEAACCQAPFIEGKYGISLSPDAPFTCNVDGQWSDDDDDKDDEEKTGENYMVEIKLVMFKEGENIQFGDALNPLTTHYWRAETECAGVAWYGEYDECPTHPAAKCTGESNCLGASFIERPANRGFGVLTTKEQLEAYVNVFDAGCNFDYDQCACVAGGTTDAPTDTPAETCDNTAIAGPQGLQGLQGVQGPAGPEGILPQELKDALALLANHVGLLEEAQRTINQLATTNSALATANSVLTTTNSDLTGKLFSCKDGRARRGAREL